MTDREMLKEILSVVCNYLYDEDSMGNKNGTLTLAYLEGLIDRHFKDTDSNKVEIDSYE